MESVNYYNSDSDFIIGLKAIRRTIKNNVANLCVIGAMIGSLIFTCCTIGKCCKSLVNTYNYVTAIIASEETMTQNNDEALNELMNNNIVVANVSSSVLQDYYFANGSLYDKDGNKISLAGVEKGIVFANCRLDKETLDNIDFSLATSTYIDLSYSSIDEEGIKSLPSTVECVRLDYCNYFTNLNSLASVCPNLKIISVNNAASLSDLSFIYELKNLKEIYLNDCPYVTQDLLDYLTANNIATNLTQKDVINSKKTDEIIESIITEDMNDKEKVKAICLYVLDMLEYDISKSSDSNNDPLTMSYEDGKVVCASYAYLTNVLLNKAGIQSYKVTNDDHTWNMIVLDGEYFYVDTTSMDGKFINKLLLYLFNVSRNYMVDPEYTDWSSMSSASSGESDIMSSMIDDIVRGSSNKNIVEKYGGMVLSGTLSFLNFLSCAYFAFYIYLLSSGIALEVTEDIFYDLRGDYWESVYYERQKNLRKVR